MSLDGLAEFSFAPIRASVDAGRIPGAVLGLVSVSGERATRWAGAVQRTPTLEAMRRETWFDLASLTKVIFTTTTILRLAEQDRLGLDEPLAQAIPDLRQYHAAAPERGLTYRQCLAHQTHLPAVEPLYSYGLEPQTLRAFILQRAWLAGPPVYSDINFMLLGIAIERLTGTALKDLPQPAGLSFSPDAAACAATMFCPWRGRLLRGEVDDENAYALGGAAGHAGLFGTVDAVLDFAQSLLDGRALRPQSITLLRERQGGNRTLGWEMRHEGWSGGEACSAQSIGHTGFTGTGLWIDWERGLAWSLLTNRVHPSRHAETGIATLRCQVGERAIEAFDRAR